MKNILGIYSAPRPHWVGDGFPVRSLFSYDSHREHLSPFLLLDYAGPAQFAPAKEPRGVGEHPHRGFETVTIVYQGEVAHCDSTGAGGRIGPGDVQWMTAASGILHEEFHSPEFTRSGGTQVPCPPCLQVPYCTPKAPLGSWEASVSARPRKECPSQYTGYGATSRVSYSPGANLSIAASERWPASLVSVYKPSQSVPTL